MAFTSVKQSDSRSIRSISNPLCITNFSVRFNAITSVCRAEDVETDFANPSINRPEEFLHTQATKASMSRDARASCTTNSAFGSCWRKMKVFLAFQMCHRRAEINSRSGHSVLPYQSGL
ncbi:uncharacterized protein LOC120295636 isoform X1 [Eucalyptus grandis]|uniref:uncharacterized protein LOC120295636 isoform X1 n=1 Tax=Eucalyptus grandis TaxID=71139 RepID=UPI00192EB9CA|nr:uncharacterized protein LOC120295636 isoform X1 [Eucalyptus grandis]